MINTRLLIRTNTEIRILDTEYYDGGYVALRVDDITNYDVRVGDILSVRFDNPNLAPEYAGSHEVIIVSPTSSCCLTDNENSIVLALAWGNSTPTNSGWAKNILRVNDGGLLSDAGSGFTGTGLNGFAYMQATDQFSDGTLLVGGFFTQYSGTGANRVVGINLDGTIDTSFAYGTGLEGNGGGGITVATNIKIDSLDRAYITGGFLTYDGTTSRNIVRVLRDGTIDTTFNVGSGLQGSTTFGYSIEIDETNNKVYIGGQFTSYNGTSINRLVRVLTDGSIDGSFTIGTGFNGPVRKVVLFDNKLYVVGEFTQFNGNNVGRIVRLNLDGSYDSTFNTAGAGFNTGAAFDILITSGKIYVVGDFTQFNGVSANRIVRLNSDGSRDNDFVVGTGLNNTAYVITQHNGFLYVGGDFNTYKGETSNRLVVIDFYGNRNPNFIGVFNAFVQVIFPVGENEILIGGNFTSYNGQTINRISIFRSFFTSVIYQPVELDLKEDIQFPLTFNLVDIRSPQNRKSDFSKTITLPGTKNNNRILKHLFEISADSIFNPNIKKDAFVINDGLEVFSGFMKLEKINRDDWENVTYDIKIFGRLTTLFSKLVNDFGEDLMLSDLDFSEWGHIKVRDNIIKSWNGIVKKDNVDYNNFIIGPTFSVLDTQFVPGGRTKFVLSTAPTGIEVGDIVRFDMDFPNDPSVNFNESQGHHTVIDVGTNSVSINLEFNSGGANSGTMSKWESKGEGYVYPTVHTGGTFSLNNWPSNVFETHFYLKEVIDKVFKYIDFSYESDFFNSQLFKRLIIPYQDFSIKSKLLLTLQNTGSPVATQGVETNIPFQNSIDFDSWEVDLVNYEYKSLISKSYDFDFSMSGNITNYFSGTLRYAEVVIYSEYNPITDSIDPNWVSGTGYQASRKRIFEVNGQPNPGSYEGGTNDNFVNTTLNITGSGGFFFNTFVKFKNINILQDTSIRVKILFVRQPSNVSSLIVTNCTFANSEIDIVKDIKVKDILTSLISMFNLYIETDSFNPRNVRIETYNDFYQIQDSKDWTNKLDLSKQVQIEPTSPEISKTFKWSYKEDGDLYNKDYKDSYEVVYGYEEYVTETQFNNNVTEFKSLFSQSPLVDLNTSGNLIVPVIVKDEQLNKQDRYNTRVYYWTGIRYSNQFSIDGISTSDYYELPMYGYGGHLDNPKDATLDLNFGISETYYYGSNYNFYITENTLYNAYYSRYIEEISDKDSRILRAYFKVTSYDINTLSFRRFYYINNDLYRLQSIIDWDPINTQTTLCEFIKVNRSLISIPIQRTNPILIGNISRRRNLPNMTIYGDNNFVGPYSTGLVIVGNGNNVESNSQNGFVFGNGNTVSGTASNVFLVGNNITATNSSIVLGGPNDNVNIGNIELENETGWRVGGFNEQSGFGPVNTGYVTSTTIVGNNADEFVIGGNFTSYRGNTHNRLVRIFADGSTVDSFNTNLGTGFNGTVFATVQLSNGKILVGGSFTSFNGNTRRGLVLLNDDGTEDTTFYTNLGTGFEHGVLPQGSVFSLLDTGALSILVGGQFNTLNGNTRQSLVLLNYDGTEIVSFYTNLGTGIDTGGYIAALGINFFPDKFIVGGSFDNFNGNARGGLICLNFDGTEDATFATNIGTGFNNPSSPLDGPIFNIKQAPGGGGKLLIGGGFTTFDGSTRVGLVLLNIDGTEDTDFATNLGSGFTPIGGVPNYLSSVVSFIHPMFDNSINDDRIIVSGEFIEFNGQPRERIIRLRIDGTEDTDFYNELRAWADENSGVGSQILDGSIRSVVDSQLLLGFTRLLVFGNIDVVLGQSRGHSFDLTNIDESQMSTDTVTIDNLLKLTPQFSDPINPVEGDVYYRSGVGIKFFDGTVWRTLDFT